MLNRRAMIATTTSTASSNRVFESSLSLVTWKDNVVVRHHNYDDPWTLPASPK